MKDWISQCLALEEALAQERDEAARPAVIESFASRFKVGCRTSSRALTALAWLRPELKRFDVALENFPLSLVSTETLRRIAFLDRRRLNAIMPAVVLGKLTYSDLVNERDRLALQNYMANSPAKDVDKMIDIIVKVITSIENAGELETISDLDMHGQAIALPDKSMQANQSKIAIFYPPSWGASRTIAVALCRVFSSLCFYDRSYFIFEEAQHGDLFEEARNEVPPEISVKLITIPLAQISQSAVLRAATVKKVRGNLLRDGS